MFLALGRAPAVGCLGMALSTIALADEPLEAPPEEEAPPAVQPYLTAGLIEVMGLAAPVQHLGLYVSVSLDVGFVLSPDWMLIPSLGFEFDPQYGHWGGTFFLILDRFLAQTKGAVITLEPQIGLIHDAAPVDGGFDHAFFLSPALGVAFITPRATFIPQLGASIGLGGEGWALSPMFLFSVPI